MSDETVVPDDAAVADPLPPPPPPPRRASGRCRWPSASCSSPGWPRSAPGRSMPASPACTPSTPTLARLFVVVAVAQIGVGLLALVKGGRLAAVATVLVNLGAVAAWGATRLWGISWIDGLEVAEDPQFTDTACAVLGAIAVVAALVALVRGRTRVVDGAPRAAGVRRRRRHAGGDARRRRPHAQPRRDRGGRRLRRRGAASPPTDGHAHSHDEEAQPTDAPVAAAAPADWPRPFDPPQPVDLSGVDGVTPEQELRATALVQRHAARSCRRSPTSTSLDALGYRSIGDSRTGYEHYINYSLINDDVILDPTQPESLVFRVDGDERTLVSAMFIVGQRAIDDPELVDYGGRLMQWHVHENLCWRGGDDGPQVAGVTDAEGNCPAGHRSSRRRQPDGPRVDRRPRVRPVRRPRRPRRRPGRGGRRHTHRPVRARRRPRPRRAQAGRGRPPTAAAAAAAAPVPYDPAAPDRPVGHARGHPRAAGVRREPRRRRRSATCRSGPTPPSAEAAGFHSIGDAATGYEHYIQWDWIDDDVGSIPTTRRASSTASSPTAHARWRRRCTCSRTRWRSTTSPTDGGALMQWHVHGDLCFDVSDPEAPRVGGLTDSAGGCTAPLVASSPSRR